MRDNRNGGGVGARCTARSASIRMPGTCGARTDPVLGVVLRLTIVLWHVTIVLHVDGNVEMLVRLEIFLVRQTTHRVPETGNIMFLNTGNFMFLSTIVFDLQTFYLTNAIELNFVLFSTYTSWKSPSSTTSKFWSSLTILGKVCYLQSQVIQKKRHSK